MKGIWFGIAIALLALSAMALTGPESTKENTRQATADAIISAPRIIETAATPDSAPGLSSPATSGAAVAAPESAQPGQLSQGDPFLKKLSEFWTTAQGYELTFTKEDYFTAPTTISARYRLFRRLPDQNEGDKPYIRLDGIQGENNDMTMLFRPDQSKNGVQVRQGKSAKIQNLTPDDHRVKDLFNVPMEQWINDLFKLSQTAHAEIHEESIQTKFGKWVEEQVRKVPSPSVKLKPASMGLKISVLVPYKVEIFQTQNVNFWVQPSPDGNVFYPLRMELFGTKSVKKKGLTCASERVYDQLMFRLTWSDIKVFDTMGKESFELK